MWKRDNNLQTTERNSPSLRAHLLHHSQHVDSKKAGILDTNLVLKLFLTSFCFQFDRPAFRVPMMYHVVRTRLVTQGNNKAVRMLRAECARAFFKGLPTLANVGSPTPRPQEGYVDSNASYVDGNASFPVAVLASPAQIAGFTADQVILAVQYIATFRPL